MVLLDPKNGELLPAVLAVVFGHVGLRKSAETGVGRVAEDKLEAPQPFEHAIKQHSVSVEITAAESLSYAMVHNGFKFVRQVKITNPGTEIRGAVVRVEVFASTGRIFSRYFREIP